MGYDGFGSSNNGKITLTLQNPSRSCGKSVALPLSNGRGSHRLLLNGDEGTQGSPYLETKGWGLIKKISKIT